MDDTTNFYNSGLYKDIVDNKSENYIIQKYVLHEFPFYFATKKELWFDFKYKISGKFNIPISSIFLVGSGQFGFSLNPKNKLRNFIEDGEYTSDLDIAIVSSNLFNKYWDYIKEFSLTSLDDEEKVLKSKFLDYMLKGWIRPDLFPKNYAEKQLWFEFFKSFNVEVNRKVNCGIFRDEDCFLSYYTKSIKQIKDKVRLTK